MTVGALVQILTLFLGCFTALTTAENNCYQTRLDCEFDCGQNSNCNRKFESRNQCPYKCETKAWLIPVIVVCSIVGVGAITCGIICCCYWTKCKKKPGTVLGSPSSMSKGPQPSFGNNNQSVYPQNKLSTPPYAQGPSQIPGVPSNSPMPIQNQRPHLGFEGAVGSGHQPVPPGPPKFAPGVNNWPSGQPILGSPNSFNRPGSMWGGRGMNTGMALGGGLLAGYALSNYLDNDCHGGGFSPGFGGGGCFGGGPFGGSIGGFHGGGFDGGSIGGGGFDGGGGGFDSGGGGFDSGGGGCDSGGGGSDFGGDGGGCGD